MNKKGSTVGVALGGGGVRGLGHIPALKTLEHDGRIDATLGMFDILVEKVTKAMIEKQPPGIYFNPQLAGIRVLDFDKAQDVFKQVEAAVPTLKERLKAFCRKHFV